jgi:murein L,D-transpeptidase YcbB/YkuD
MFRPLTPAERAELDQLYQPGDYSPLWVGDDGRPNGDARQALAEIASAADEGLDPADYGNARLEGLRSSVEGESPPGSRQTASFEAALAVGTLRYVRDLHLGRIDPRSIGFRLSLPPDRHDFPALLRAAAADHRIAAFAADLRPRLAQYRALRELLPRYRALAADTSLELMPPPTETLRPGALSNALGILHRELAALGDLPPDTPPPPDSGRYEGPLIDAVKRFQVRHGLEPDGVLGKATMTALGVPLAWRVRQIEFALERLRWLPDLGERRLIAVNIPMFRLWAWDSIPPDGAPSMTMGVIVGRALSTQTPVFDEEMREVIFRPYWNIPRSILRDEILPAIERDPDYLGRQNMEIVSGAGDNAAPVSPTAEAVAALGQGRFRVRQLPGPRNALGLIKFVFPNEEDVYMHGTPAQELFARSRRDFSHGCVRVEDPVGLAEWALKDRSEWSRERIVAATADSQSSRVQLPRPIQVVLFYTTAAVMPEDGAIWFAEDIYRHDARLDRALARRSEAQ